MCVFYFLSVFFNRTLCEKVFLSIAKWLSSCNNFPRGIAQIDVHPVKEKRNVNNLIRISSIFWKWNDKMTKCFSYSKAKKPTDLYSIIVKTKSLFVSMLLIIPKEHSSWWRLQHFYHETWNDKLVWMQEWIGETKLKFN